MAIDYRGRYDDAFSIIKNHINNAYCRAKDTFWKWSRVSRVESTPIESVSHHFNMPTTKRLRRVGTKHLTVLTE